MTQSPASRRRLIEDLNASSSSASDESDAESDRSFVPVTERPSFAPIEASKVLSRLRQFLPVFQSAPLPGNCDPEFIEEQEPEILIGEGCDMVEHADKPEPGVEMDIQMGVFDVQGDVREIERMGFPIVDLPDDKEVGDLIEEISTPE